MGGTESESEINRTQKLQFALQSETNPRILNGYELLSISISVTKYMCQCVIFINCKSL